jgi:uroporphyrinogen III methyltransferase/synthase
VVIVGDVAKESEVSNWFTTRPLFGRTILITRPEHQSDDLAMRLQNLGANVLRQPAIEIGPPTNWTPIDQTIERLPDFDWLVFSSSNGVEYYLGRLLALGHDMRRLASVRLAAIGPGTAAALAEFHLKANVQPDTYRAESLAESLTPFTRGKRVLLIRASRGREVLAEMLTAAGAIVEQVVVYESRDVETADKDIANELAAGNIDVTTVTSSAIAHSLVRLFGNDLRKTRLAGISPVTATTLTELGFQPAIVAETYTTEGLVNAILAAESGKA